MLVRPLFKLKLATRSTTSTIRGQKDRHAGRQIALDNEDLSNCDRDAVMSFLSSANKVQIETLTQTIQAKLTRAGELGVEISIIQEDLADAQGGKLPVTTRTPATPTAMPS